MSIHEHQPPQAKKGLKDIGGTKGREFAKVARAEGQRFDCAPWVHKARTMPREEFRREMEKELTGKEEEASELIYFKVHKSQVPVIEQAIETAALMLGSDKSRGYCLEMICADFLAGANLESGDPKILLQSMMRFFKFLPNQERNMFFEQVGVKASSSNSTHEANYQWTHTKRSGFRYWRATVGDARHADVVAIFRFITNGFGPTREATTSKI